METVRAGKMVVRLPMFLFTMLLTTLGIAASPTPPEVKKDGEAAGYISFSTHDEIVGKAKREGELRVSSGLDTPNLKPLINAFRQKYPFFTNVRVDEINGNDAYQRFLLEIKSGQAKGWDITHIPLDFAGEYTPYLMKYDILSMVKGGVLKIHPAMVHPVERNILGYSTTLQVVSYNKNLISEDKVPDKWEDFLKPEFKGKKFVVDLRPFALACLVPTWGLEKTLDYARKLAAQEPVWGTGAPRFNTLVAAGQYPLYLSSTFTAVKRVMNKDQTGNLGYKVIEPVPTRIVDHSSGILNTSPHPNSALLWLEFLASPEAQEIIDKYEPLRASMYSVGSATEQLTRGKKLSVVDWANFTKFQQYQEKIVAAFGFPRADK